MDVLDREKFERKKKKKKENIENFMLSLSLGPSRLSHSPADFAPPSVRQEAGIINELL